MRRLSKPPFNVATVYTECIKTVNDVQLKNKLSGCLAEITSDETLFETLAENTQLYRFPLKTVVNGSIDIPEMKKIYTYRMVSNTGREYYDMIFESPKNGICPLCGQREVETVDHYLPKTLYPTLVVTPTNLIPSCSACNRIKLTSIPTCSEDEPIHPYYDDIESERWLFSTLARLDSGFVIKFEVRAPATWNPVKVLRVEKHLSKFLSSLYSKRAGVELTEKKPRLNDLRKIGITMVQEYLSELAYDFSRVYTNSWQTAMYETLAEDTWFHEEGIYLID
ncbi:hypothetical protein BHU72_01930 [Desulfuribacillus stibiiarsenatis]|uniref:HNH endonuclease n=1 Tax=Desulfuribacillus stibiiarsenatis TaxID=1390249 RepID=A0A1E5L600_9FIRM|nr:HNH endonuclease signature motif containing protein [Desulfuribacillus stibiiarsenatis]OEH85582.1 hypothetical protein BHU72_01930 [Desulfuribacillus stibiiarsenatis]